MPPDYDVGYNPNNADDKPGTSCFFPWSHPCWSCTDWITWHKALKAKYGDAKAHDIWTNAWKDINDWVDPNGWACKYDNEFWTYIKANQLDASDFIADVLHSATDSVSSAAQAVSNLVGGGEKLTNVLKWAIPIAGLVVLAGFTWMIVEAGSKEVKKHSPSSSASTGEKGKVKNLDRGKNGRFQKKAA